MQETGDRQTGAAVQRPFPDAAVQHCAFVSAPVTTTALLESERDCDERDELIIKWSQFFLSLVACLACWLLLLPSVMTHECC